MFQALADAFDVLQPGWLELPASYARGLAKGLSHRYIKRVPTGKLTKTGKPRYRYFYKVGHGGTVANHEHFVVGASFRHDGGHWHITGADGDKLTIRHDETGEEQKISRGDLGKMLGSYHAEGIAEARAAALADLAAGRANGASPKQVERLKGRAKGVGASSPVPKDSQWLVDMINRHTSGYGWQGSITGDGGTLTAPGGGTRIELTQVGDQWAVRKDGAEIGTFAKFERGLDSLSDAFERAEERRTTHPSTQQIIDAFETADKSWHDGLRAGHALISLKNGSEWTYIDRKAVKVDADVDPEHVKTRPLGLHVKERLKEHFKDQYGDTTYYGASSPQDAMTMWQQKVDGLKLVRAETMEQRAASPAWSAAGAKLDRAIADIESQRPLFATVQAVTAGARFQATAQVSAAQELVHALRHAATDAADLAVSAPGWDRMPEGRASGVGADIAASADSGQFKEGAYTSKKGNLKKVAVFTSRVDGDAFKAVAALAKEHGGSYIRDAGGFVFMGDAGFAAFMAAQGGGTPSPTPATEPIATPERPPKAAPSPRRMTKWQQPMFGEKYEHGRDIKDVAKLVRADVKAAVAAGALPEGTEVSAKISRYSMGQSVHVTITAAPFQVLSHDRLKQDRDRPHDFTMIPWKTPEAAEVENRVTAILNAYNKSFGDAGEGDRRSFHGHASFASEVTNRDRDAFHAGASPMTSAVTPTAAQAGPSGAAPVDTGVQASKLRAGSAKWRAAAAEALGRDRSVNTRRRASFAASAVSDAFRQEQIADTVDRVAAAIETGAAPALAGMTSMAQADMIQSFMRSAQSMAMPYAEYVLQRESVPDASVARFVKYPGENNPDARAKLTRMGIGTQAQLANAVQEWITHSKPLDSGAAHKAKEHIAESDFMRQGIQGFFPTPKPLATRMVALADVQPGMTVLEPSAGTGRLADAAKAAGGAVTTLETSGSLQEHLQKKGHAVAGRDALGHGEKYDRVVMNPPFENGQDIDHVRHAFDANLKPGGKLVAVVSEGPFFRQDKKASEFRGWLARHGGTSEKLPAGTFDESGTGVATRLVTVEKQADKPGDALRAKADELTRQAESTWSVHTPATHGNLRTKASGRRVDADIKRSVVASGLHRQAQVLNARAALADAFADRPSPPPPPSPATPTSVAEKPRHTVKADQNRRNVTPARAEAEAALWRRTHADFKGFSAAGVPQIIYRSALTPLALIPDDVLVQKGAFSPLTAAFEAFP